MTRTLNKLFLPIVTLMTAFTLQTAHAEQALLSIPDSDRFIVQLPAVDRAALAEELGALRSELIQRKQVLAQIVEDRKLDGNDAIITAIMPGGLLYAGIRKARYERARDELARISTDIAELSDDLQAMQSASAPTVVAQLR